ncbi:MAG: serine hydrolase [Thermoprotei archaeon]|nr:serine hydrolase [Thermoprotei archaeon]
MLDWGLIEGFIIEKMSEYRMPGVSIAVVRGGDVIYARGFGYRDVDRMVPASPGTVYGIGSITKSFTALAVMTLYERGLLDLWDPVSKYVEFELKVAGEPVAIHHLLTHSSGIPALAYAEAFIRGSLGLDSKWLPLSYPDDVIAFMRGYESWVEGEPGSKFFYLNEGYVILGKIVEKVSGVSYEDYVRRTILEPLGMRRSYFKREDVERDADVAVGYIVDREGRLVAGKFPYGVTADGGLLSNPLDMVRYASMLLNWGVYGGSEIVGRKSVEAMETPHIKLPYESAAADYYGYGLMIKTDFYGRKLVGHGGSVLTYTAYMGYVRGDNVGVVIMANSSGYPLSLLGQYVIAHMMGVDPESLEPVKLERILSKVAGTYETFKGTMRLTVKRKQGTLIIEYKDKYVEEVTPLTPQRIEEDYALFYAHTLTGRIPVEFRIRGDKVEMIYERYKLVKVGR